MPVAVTAHPMLSKIRHTGAESREATKALRHRYGPFVLVGLIGILARLPFYLAFRPICSGDSHGYVLPYFLWRNHVFYLGERTPVYPLFLGLAQWLVRVPASPRLPFSAAYVTVGLQSVLDIIAACVLYFTLGKLNIRRNIALVGALFAATFPALCSSEVNILNLSLSFAVLVLCTSIFATLIKRVSDGSRFVCMSLLCGLVFACAALLRPENLIFCSILATVLLGSWVISKLRGVTTFYGNRAPVAVLLMILSATPLILAWMIWNYAGIGEFRITTLTGWNRSKTVYNMFDRVEPEDRVLGQILSNSYLRRNRNGRIVRDHIWQARADILDHYFDMPVEVPTESPSAFHMKVDRFFADQLGMINVPCATPDQLWCSADLRRWVHIGNYVGRVSGKLIRKYPSAYLGNVADNFVRDTFNFRYANSNPAREDVPTITVDGGDYVRNEFLAKLSAPATNAQAPLLMVFYFVTLGFVVFAPLVFMSKASEYHVADIIVTGFALATVGTFIAMCFLSGYNKEYSIPHLGVMVICAAYAVENWSRIAAATGLRSHNSTATAREPHTEVPFTTKAAFSRRELCQR
jgi:hypothetical protein